jgi:hypothetical protein
MTCRSVRSVKTGLSDLVTIAYCDECHTPQQKGSAPDIRQRYAGGQAFRTPYGSVVSANITPDKDTGIGNWISRGYATAYEHFRRSIPLWISYPNRPRPFHADALHRLRGLYRRRHGGSIRFSASADGCESERGTHPATLPAN